MYNAQAIQRSYQGNFNICVDVMFDTSVLYDLITSFQNLYPRINVNLETDLYYVKHRILNGEFDIAMAHIGSEDANKGLSCKKIMEYPVCFLVSKDHPLAGKENLNLSDFVSGGGKQFIVPSDPFSEDYVWILQEFFKNTGAVPGVLRSVRSARLEYQALFNQEAVVVGIPPCVRENRKETLEFLKEHIKVFYIDDLTISLDFCWRTNHYTPQIRDFLNVYEKLMDCPEAKQRLEQSAYKNIFD